MTSVAATGVKRPTRTIVPFTSPVASAAPSMSASPSTTVGRDLPCVRKNDETTTTSPVSGPTEMSMPAVMITISWPKLMNASAASSVSSEVMLKAEMKREFEP